MAYRDYESLTAAVRLINPEAADYMAGVKPPELETGSPSWDISSAFIWAGTPQGHTFWNEIENALFELDNCLTEKEFAEDGVYFTEGSFKK